MGDDVGQESLLLGSGPILARHVRPPQGVGRSEHPTSHDKGSARRSAEVGELAAEQERLAQLQLAQRAGKGHVGLVGEGERDEGAAGEVAFELVLVLVAVVALLLLLLLVLVPQDVIVVVGLVRGQGLADVQTAQRSPRAGLQRRGKAARFVAGRLGLWSGVAQGGSPPGEGPPR
jgi:hypothetical protein